jgi:hypothetical protein
MSNWRFRTGTPDGTAFRTDALTEEDLRTLVLEDFFFGMDTPPERLWKARVISA